MIELNFKFVVWKKNYFLLQNVYIRFNWSHNMENTQKNIAYAVA